MLERCFRPYTHNDWAKYLTNMNVCKTEDFKTTFDKASADIRIKHGTERIETDINTNVL